MSPTKGYTDYVRIDIGKETFVAAKFGIKKTKTYKNTAAGIQLFITDFIDKPEETLVALENTGGYERQVLSALYNAKIAVHKAHAVLIKRFIASFGTKDKTDSIDATHIAFYAKERGHTFKLFCQQDAKQECLRQLVERRQDLITMRTQEKNRFQSPNLEHTKNSVIRMLASIEEEIGQIDAEIKKLQHRPEEKEILETLCGIGPIIFQTLLGAQIASMSGLAPHPRDSGMSAKPRFISGGRALSKKALFGAALTASHTKTPFGDYYRRLLAAGKKPMVALMALARKILVIANAKLRDYYKTLLVIEVVSI